MKRTKVLFEGISKLYERNNELFFALKDVNLELFDNEILSLVGPSGCGKTTLLNIAAGFIRPDEGRVLFDDQKVRGPVAKSGVVFQADSVFPWMTVAENVGYGLRFNGTSKQNRAEAVSRYLTLVGLSEVAGVWPRELSGGMKKRVDLARAYAFNPSLLLLDEPFGSLDVMTKEEMHLLLHKIWQSERKTVLFVTHDVEEAIFLGHRVAVMSPGPGSIKKVIDVPFDVPRDPSIKLSEDFLSLRRQLVDALRQSRGAST